MNAIKDQKDDAATPIFGRRRRMHSLLFYEFYASQKTGQILRSWCNVQVFLLFGVSIIEDDDRNE